MAVTTKQQKLTGAQKVATFMMVLGTDLSSKLMKDYFSEEEMEAISYEITNTPNITTPERRLIIDEFFQLKQAREYIVQGGVKYARELLDKAVGHHKSSEIIKKLMAASKMMPFSFLKKADPKHVANFIANEHPQTIALILSYLEPEQSSAILALLTSDRQSDIAKRIALMERASPEVIMEIEKVLESKLSTLVQTDFSSSGGINSLVDILNRVDRSTEKTILETLENEDPKLVEEIRKRLFVFEDVIALDDSSIQRVLREVDSRALALALKGANGEVSERILKNLSKRAAEMIREDIDIMGPIRLRDVEEAQQNIVKIIRTLDETGEIIISRGGEDAIVY